MHWTHRETLDTQHLWGMGYLDRMKNFAHIRLFFPLELSSHKDLQLPYFSIFFVLFIGHCAWSNIAALFAKWPMSELYSPSLFVYGDLFVPRELRAKSFDIIVIVISSVWHCILLARLACLAKKKMNESNYAIRMHIVQVKMNFFTVAIDQHLSGIFKSSGWKKNWLCVEIALIQIKVHSERIPS